MVRAVRASKSSIGPAEPAKRRAGRPRRKLGAPTHRRVTEQIRYPDAANWSRAIDYATFALDRPVTVHVTVQWQFAPSTTPEPERVSDLLNQLGVWIRRRTHQRAVWAYSREGGLRRSVHLHLLAHIPRDLIDDFRAAVNRWVGAKADSCEARAVRVDRIHLPTLNGLKSYLLKEGDDQVHQACGVITEHRDQRNGYPVPGKRLGVSHSINATARSRHSPVTP